MHVQKALILIEYLLRNGADRFIRDAKQRSRDIQKLRKYKHYDQNNEDDAKDARLKAKRVYDLLSNDKLLQEARTQAEKIKGMRITGSGTDVDGGYGGRSGGHHGGYGGHSGGGGSGGEPDRYSSFTPDELAQRNGNNNDGSEQTERPKKKKETQKKDEEEDEDDDKQGGQGGQEDDPFGPVTEVGSDPGSKSKKPSKEKSGQNTVAPKKAKKKKDKPKKQEPQSKDVPKKEIQKPTVEGDDPFSAQFDEGEDDDDTGGFQPRAGEKQQSTTTSQSKPKGGGGFNFAAAFDESPSSNFDILTSDPKPTPDFTSSFDKLSVAGIHSSLFHFSHSSF